MPIEITNLKYASADNSFIDMDVAGVVEGQTIPFTYHVDDPEPLSLIVKDLLAGGGYTIAAYVAPPVPVPQSITFRQFYQQLYIQGIIDEPSLLDAVKIRTMPAPLQTLVDGITDAPTKLNAQVLIYGGTEILRAHPITAVIIAAFGWSEAQGDAFFQAAHAL